GRQPRQGFRAPRPRRRRLPLRPEVDVSSQGSERNADVRQRRRERAGDLQQPPLDGAGSPPVARGHPDRVLRHPGEHRLHLPAFRVYPGLPYPRGGTRGGPRRRPRGQEHLRLGLQPGHLGSPRRGSLHLRRGDRPDREPRRQARLAPHQAAIRKPTVVNNVETLCCVPHILERGATWFKSIGTPKSYGPKLYTISGHVNRQVCVELPLGITCRALIEGHGGGVWKGRKAKAAVPGGISMGLLSANELDTPLDFESLRKPGCLGLGTAAVTVLDDQTRIIDYLYNTCRFFAHESCGQCTPCREGTGWLNKMIQRIRSGGGRLEDLDLMLNLADNLGIMPGTTICGLADGAAWPIKNAIAKFRGELEDHIRTHQSPAHEVSRLQEDIAQGRQADDSRARLPILNGLLTAPASSRQAPGSGSV